MLDFLRKRKDSIFVKILFGIIILAFVIFFGSDTLRKGAPGQNASPASVNGVEVSGLKTSFLIDSQLEELKNSVGGQIPESYTDMIRNNVINGLINSELVNQNTRRLGLATTQDELKKIIRSNPQFIENNKFNTDFYLNKFLPWYQLTRGTSYEADLREQLAATKIANEFQNIFEFSDAEIKLQHQLQNTKYGFSIIKISKEKGVNNKDALPKEIDVKDTPASAQKDLADQVWAKWKKGEPLDDFLTTNELEKIPSRELKLTELKAVFDGKQDVALIRELLKLTEKTTFPENYFDVDQFYYLVKLDSLTLAPTPSDQDLTGTREQLMAEQSNTIESAWIRELRRTANIKIH